jgi:ubiquinol oxidase
MSMMQDVFAQSMTKFFRFFADTFFAKRYGHRAVVLETIAGVPGMVAGMLVHLRSLRKMESGNGTMIHEMLAEAENERKHLMFFIEIAQPNKLERGLIVLAQFIFWHFYLIMYIVAPKTAHRMIHYFEAEAVRSYTDYIQLVESGKLENVPAPSSAIRYYGLSEDAQLVDMLICIRADEEKHSQVNMEYSL